MDLKWQTSGCDAKNTKIATRSAETLGAKSRCQTDHPSWGRGHRLQPTCSNGVGWGVMFSRIIFLLREHDDPPPRETVKHTQAGLCGGVRLKINSSAFLTEVRKDESSYRVVRALLRSGDEAEVDVSNSLSPSVGSAIERHLLWARKRNQHFCLLLLLDNVALCDC